MAPVPTPPHQSCRHHHPTGPIVCSRATPWSCPQFTGQKQSSGSCDGSHSLQTLISRQPSDLFLLQPHVSGQDSTQNHLPLALCCTQLRNTEPHLQLLLTNPQPNPGHRASCGGEGLTHRTVPATGLPSAAGTPAPPSPPPSSHAHARRCAQTTRRWAQQREPAGQGEAETRSRARLPARLGRKGLCNANAGPTPRALGFTSLTPT